MRKHRLWKQPVQTLPKEWGVRSKEGLVYTDHPAARGGVRKGAGRPPQPKECPYCGTWIAAQLMRQHRCARTSIFGKIAYHLSKTIEFMHELEDWAYTPPNSIDIFSARDRYFALTRSATIDMAQKDGAKKKGKKNAT